MAGRFWAGGRQYTDTPAGRLLAAKDKVADKLRMRGHRMMFWSKDAKASPPYFSARCRTCGAGVKVVAGRAPAKLRGYPSLVRLGKILNCPGRPR